MSEKVCRWGILSTASIAQKNWQSIWLAENATVSAVASRRIDKANDFIQNCQSHVPFPQVPQAFGSYESMLASDLIDAVYIPLPTGLRKEWVLKAAQAGKHIICEKPCGVTTADLKEMIDACEENNVQFMDGVMFNHSERLTKLRETIDDGQSIGDVKRIATQFSFCAPEEFMTGNIRTSGALEPAGCLGDLGWYNIRFSLFVMGYRMPNSVTGRLLTQHKRDDSPEPVPLEFSGELFFEGGVSASFYCSFITENQEWASVSGTKGHLHVKDFVLPFFGTPISFDVYNPHFAISGCDFNMEGISQNVKVNEYSNSNVSSQEANMIRNFSANVLTGSLNRTWAEIALKTQQIMDACLASSRKNSQSVHLK